MTRLRWDMPAPIMVARNATGTRVLLGRLGVLGVGQMWFDATSEHKTNSEWEKLPIVEEK